jgi:hypothetical protein
LTVAVLLMTVLAAVDAIAASGARSPTPTAMTASLDFISVLSFVKLQKCVEVR